MLESRGPAQAPANGLADHRHLASLITTSVFKEKDRVCLSGFSAEQAGPPSRMLDAGAIRRRGTGSGASKFHTPPPLVNSGGVNLVYSGQEVGKASGGGRKAVLELVDPGRMCALPMSKSHSPLLSSRRTGKRESEHSWPGKPRSNACLLTRKPRGMCNGAGGKLRRMRRRSCLFEAAGLGLPRPDSSLAAFQGTRAAAR